jgi:hypothetical protein
MKHATRAVRQGHAQTESKEEPVAFFPVILRNYSQAQHQQDSKGDNRGQSIRVHEQWPLDFMFSVFSLIMASQDGGEPWQQMRRPPKGNQLI